MHNELFSPDDDKNKEISSIIEYITITEDKDLIFEIWDENYPRRIICQVPGEDYVDIIHMMLTIRLVYSKWN